MKFHQLRDFVAVAEAGSLRGAARVLGLAQPSITRSIQELEHALGAQLFTRESRGVSLTPIGAEFRDRAIAILEDIRRAGEAVRQQQDSAEGELVAGLSVAAHLGLLPEVLGPFHRRYPQVQLRLIEGLLPMLEADLRTGQIDMYIGPVHPGPAAPDLKITQLFENERVVVARRGHPLADARRLADLAEAVWVTTSITRDAADELTSVFAGHGLPPPVLGGQCQSALSNLTLLLNTDFLSMMPVQWVRSAVVGDLLAELKLEEKFPAPPMALVHKAGLGLTPAAEHFAHLIQRAAQKMPGDPGA